jgi:hypothetical protein
MPVEAGLASLSTMLQMDLSTYDLDKPLPATIQTRAIQGIRSQLDRFYMSGRTPTLRDIATRKVSIDSKPYIGTAERVADELARTIDAVGSDGFAIRQGIWPGYVGPFVEKVIPLLQQRGAVRTEYTGTTLRALAGVLAGHRERVGARAAPAQLLLYPRFCDVAIALHTSVGAVRQARPRGLCQSCVRTIGDYQTAWGANSNGSQAKSLRCLSMVADCGR